MALAQAADRRDCRTSRRWSRACGSAAGCAAPNRAAAAAASQPAWPPPITITSQVWLSVTVRRALLNRGPLDERVELSGARYSSAARGRQINGGVSRETASFADAEASRTPRPARPPASIRPRDPRQRPRGQPHVLGRQFRLGRDARRRARQMVARLAQQRGRWRARVAAGNSAPAHGRDAPAARQMLRSRVDRPRTGCMAPSVRPPPDAARAPGRRASRASRQVALVQNQRSPGLTRPRPGATIRRCDASTTQSRRSAASAHAAARRTPSASIGVVVGAQARPCRRSGPYSPPSTMADLDDVARGARRSA